MGLFGNLLELATDAIVAPLAITKDIVTLGGELTDEESSTVKLLEKTSEDIDKTILNE